MDNDGQGDLAPDASTDIRPRARWRLRGGRSGWVGVGWVGVGWVLAAVAAVASLWFPAFELRAPLVSNLDPGQPTAYAVTTFDAWGGSTTTTIGAGLSFQVPGGPDYAVGIIPCAVVLVAAALARARRRATPRTVPSVPSVSASVPASLPASVPASIVTSVGGPVAAGALGAIAGCQLLAYAALLRPSPPGGVYGGGEQRPEGALGWGLWLIAAGALIALTTCVLLVRPRPAETAAPTVQTGPAPTPLSPGPSEPAEPLPPPVAYPDHAIFRRPDHP